MNIETALPLDSTLRLRIRVRGVVQGVGFRPFAYGLASRLGLAGFVLNDAEGVLIEVEGPRTDAFVQTLRRAPPPLARVDGIEISKCTPKGEANFAIGKSRAGHTLTRIGADASLCEACLSDLFDPRSRFYHYPLVNCTHCGPRYTITRGLPYDRAQTSMAPYCMCVACARDYADPANRRFHAEAIACNACGPELDAEIDEIAARILEGGIVGVKGIGGYHLICDATNERAVARLRERKAREAKPFATMALNSASAELFVEMNRTERALFECAAAPIVLMRLCAFVPPLCLGGDTVHHLDTKEALKTRRLAASVAPGLAEAGLMRAYTPLHWLIFHALSGRPDFVAWRDAPCEIALVATSANVAGEPLIADDEEARERLADIADLVVSHSREIVVRADDSVMRVIDGAPTYLRRARGFVPDPIDLGVEAPSLIAHGADLKNTITLTRGREAFVSQHLGDLDDRRTIRFREETIERLKSILGIEPEIAVSDLHPDFVSTRAAESSGLIGQRVQHHVAHVVATAAERGWVRALGVALDGFGFGADGGSWGGELIALDGADWRRIGHLSPLALPGGDRAAREPWRMGVAMLHRLGRGGEAGRIFPDIPEATRWAERLASGARVQQTTSLGRLFDAFAALARIRDVQRYEGQAAMEMEALVRTAGMPSDAWRLEGGVLDLSMLAAEVIDRRPTLVEAATTFHATLVAALAAWVGAGAREAGLSCIALGGGCLANRVLAEGLSTALRAQGLEVAIPSAVPANDGGISFGQAAFVARLVQERRICV